MSAIASAGADPGALLAAAAAAAASSQPEPAPPNQGGASSAPATDAADGAGAIGEAPVPPAEPGPPVEPAPPTSEPMPGATAPSVPTSGPDEATSSTGAPEADQPSSPNIPASAGDSADAEALDAAVPVEERARLDIEAQRHADVVQTQVDALGPDASEEERSARRRELDADYYESRRVALGPDGDVYQATYDDTNGDLVLVRNNHVPETLTTVDGDEPAAPEDRRIVVHEDGSMVTEVLTPGEHSDTPDSHRRILDETGLFVGEEWTLHLESGVVEEGHRSYPSRGVVETGIERRGEGTTSNQVGRTTFDEDGNVVTDESTITTDTDLTDGQSVRQVRNERRVGDGGNPRIEFDETTTLRNDDPNGDRDVRNAMDSDDGNPVVVTATTSGSYDEHGVRNYNDTTVRVEHLNGDGDVSHSSEQTFGNDQVDRRTGLPTREAIDDVAQHDGEEGIGWHTFGEVGGNALELAGGVFSGGLRAMAGLGEFAIDLGLRQGATVYNLGQTAATNIKARTLAEWNFAGSTMSSAGRFVTGDFGGAYDEYSSAHQARHDAVMGADQAMLRDGRYQVDRYLDESIEDAERLLAGGGAQLTGPDGISDNPNLNDGEQWSADNTPLFAEGGPRIEDIVQGGTGDCAILAYLGTVVQDDPARIQDGIRDNGDGTVTVQLGPDEVTVTRELPVDASGNERGASTSRGASWVSYYEKAYAAHLGSYDALDGNRPAQVFSQLEGAAPHMISAPDDLVGFIQQRIDSGHSPIASSNSASSAATEQLDLAANHSYTVVGTEVVDGVPRILVNNPWGTGVRSLTESEFRESFKSVVDREVIFRTH